MTEDECKELAALRAAQPAADLDAVRDVRNQKLAETDYMGNSDVTMSDEWKTYRQELRDLPANSGDVAFDDDAFRLKNVTWPKKPE